jgi:dihydropyrimidine dehydrogenase (NAD+) subunit PreA
MHHGFKIIDDMLAGLENYLQEKGMQSVNELRGKALAHYSPWHELDFNYRVVASIDKSRCTGCQRCYVACLDGSHQCIHTTKGECHAYHGKSDHTQNVRLKQPPQQHAADANVKVHVPFIDEDECVGCNLCSLICPVSCIEMKEVSSS